MVALLVVVVVAMFVITGAAADAEDTNHMIACAHNSKNKLTNPARRKAGFREKEVRVRFITTL